MIAWAILAAMAVQQDGGLVVETIQAGVGVQITQASKVEIDITVREVGGKAVASSLDRGLPLWLDLADPKSAPMWRKGLAGLKVGGRRKLTAKPFWYGGPASGPTLNVFVTVRTIK